MIKSVEIKKDNTVIVFLEGNLEVSLQSQLKKELLDRLPPDASNVVLNFKKVEFIDSACLGALVGLVRNIRTSGGDVYISELTDEVRSIFQITRLDKVFKIFESISQATEAFNES